jgi:hypothetical protein
MHSLHSLQHVRGCHGNRAGSGRARVLLQQPRAAVDTAVELQASTGYAHASRSTQGPRPTMEDELRLERDAKLGFTYAGIVGG